ncbi:uncharacterized protein LOC106461595 isoform X3 [Limulus polyphemus]|uniref:Uncharacterized protein LOC106461595 isoform X3 n=1 Tax=Limulus polyphemus TaxID=6850 RepID=A0ABM1SL08_LIMPO|nr:uncharacterized protein LOC106461595 isoform X3 [Limulus polyphemus]
MSEGVCSVIENQEFHLEESLDNNEQDQVADTNLLHIPVTQLAVPGTAFSNHTGYATISAVLSEGTLASLPEGTVLQIAPDGSVIALQASSLQEDVGVLSTEAINVNQNSNLNITNVISAQNSQLETDNSGGQWSTGTETPLPGTPRNTSEESSVQQPETAKVSLQEQTFGEIDLNGLLCESEDNVQVSVVSKVSVQSKSQTVESSCSNIKDGNSSKQNNPEPQQLEDCTGTGDQPCNEADKETNTIVIDVSKPIQLGQNSLIVVNGKKCVLQHNPDTGEVVAYPVKEPEKQRKKPGRKRKEEKSHSLPEEEPLSEAEEADNEKGMLVITNEDGSVVRRSSRKRKQAHGLKDYAVGKVKLDSEDEDNIATEEEEEASEPANKKFRGRGRPRKTPLPTSLPGSLFPFLTPADGKTLMMQVPNSSIPPNLTLQDVAQQIANVLNNQMLAVSLPEQPLSSKAYADILTDPNSNTTDTQTVIQTTFQSEDTNQHANTPDLSTEETCVLQSNESPACGSSLSVSTMMSAQLANVSSSSSVLSQATTPVQSIVLSLPSVLESIPFESSVSKEDSTEYVNVSSQISKPLGDEILIHHDSSTSCDGANTSTDVNTKISIDANTLVCAVSSSSMSCVSSASTVNSDSGILSLLPNDRECNTIPKLNVSDKKTDVNFKSCVTGQKDNIIITKAQCVPEVVTSTTYELVNSKSSEATEESPFVPPSCKVQPDCQTSQVAQNSAISTVPIKRKRGRPRKHPLQSIPEDTSSSTVISLVSNIIHASLAIPESSCNSNISTVVSGLTGPATVTPITANPLPVILPKPETTAKIGLKATEKELQDLRCPKCSFQAYYSHQYQEHLVLHSEEAKHCKVCSFLCFTEEELIEHFKVLHPKLICSICNLTAEHVYVIKRHMMRHTEKSSICNICGKSYKDQYVLKAHIRTKHCPVGELFECSICGREFTRKAHLKRHVRTHNPFKPYQCDLCDYRGTERSDITKHRAIHEEPKFTCNVCGRTFRHYKNKEIHMKRHKGQRDFKCGVCDFYGYTFTDIRKHIERRHSDPVSRIVTCNLCGQTFKNKLQLKEHQETNHCGENLPAVEGTVQVQVSGGEHTNLSMQSEVENQLPDTNDQLTSLGSGVTFTLADGTVATIEDLAVQDGEFVFQGPQIYASNGELAILTNSENSDSQYAFVAADSTTLEQLAHGNITYDSNSQTLMLPVEVRDGKAVVKTQEDHTVQSQLEPTSEC